MTTRAQALVETVCTGLPAEVRAKGKIVLTGIFKQPVEGRVAVGDTGLSGDGQADLRVHGGRDKAVYAYPKPYYEVWQRELGRPLAPSQFGENLMVTEVSDELVCIGDRFRVGSCVLEVTQPRIPCFKLGLRMNDDEFPARFLQAGRLGFYLRVIETGSLRAGDTLVRIAETGHGIRVHDLWRIVFGPARDRDAARLALDTLEHLDDGLQRRLRVIAGR